MPESQQQFINGLNQDIGKDKLQNTFYYHMLNGSIVTDEGLTNGNPTNIKGNKLFIDIPDTYNVWKGYIDVVVPAGAYNFDMSIELVNMTFTGTFSTIEALFQEIKDTIAANNILTNTIGVRVSYNSTNIFIYSETQDINIIIVSFVPQNFLAANIWINSQTNLFLIGWGLIREDIYLFTTNVTNSIGGVGQIWKLTYDKITLVPTIELKYNNFLNFTIQHPIPNPGGFVGRYETINIQRIYWTDWFNPLRSMNMADSNVFATDISLVNTQSAVDFDIPLLQQVSLGGSNVAVAVYQLSYRLKTTNGSVTTFSEPSNMVYIVPQDEADCTNGSKFAEYIGANQGTLTSKQIRWRIYNLDLDYERIEAVIIKRFTVNSLPIIELFLDEPIPSSGTIDITYGGQDAIISFSVDEFTILASAFTHCKTIASKDNYLFAANTRRTAQDLANYDARAYRYTSDVFPVTPRTAFIDGVGYIGIVIGLPEIDDAINTDPINGRYQENGTTLGGSGQYISYEFGTLAVRVDSTIDFPPCFSGTVPGAFRRTNSDNISQLDLNVPEQDGTIQFYPTNGINSSTKFVYYSSLLRSYQREEIYRFAIQLFDKSKNPYFDKWICDIQMPGIYDDDGVINNHLYEDGTLQPFTDYRLTFTANRVGYTEAFAKHLFVKFTVNIPDFIRSQVAGYTITRLEREDRDKTILGFGLLNPVQMGGTTGGASGTDIYLPETNILVIVNISLNVEGDNSNIGGHGRAINYTLESPDFKLEGFGGYQSGDQLKVVAKIQPTSIGVLDLPCGGGIPSLEQFHMIKFYDFTTLPIQPTDTYDIEKAVVLETAQSYALQGNGATGFNFHNYTREFTVILSSGIYHSGDGISLGCRTLFLELFQGVDLLYTTGYLCTQGNQNKLLATYFRPVSTAIQYGGNTYSQRSLNEYISCMGYRPIDSTGNGSVIDVIDIFGGDVFVSVWDEQKEIKYWTLAQAEAFDSNMAYPPDGVAESYSVYFPTESVCNHDLRHGIHPNASLFSNTGAANADTLETYDYNQVYSSENDFRLLFPKPTQVADTDELDNRIYNSDLKINGELQDSWRIFREDNFIDVDGNLGPINELINFNNLLYYWQDIGFGSAAVNARSLIQDTDGASLTLGTGDILNRFDYISTTIGSKHQFSFTIGRSSIVWLDINKRKYFKFSQQGLQEMQGLNGFLNTHLIGDIITNDNPYIKKGATSTYDFNKNEFLLTVHNPTPQQENTSFTVGYLDRTGQIEALHSFYSFLPAVYINDTQNIFTAKLISTEDEVFSNELWIHNEGNYGSFYGTLYPFSITVIVNPNPLVEKAFDSFQVSSECFKFAGGVSQDDIVLTIDQLETFSNYRAYNGYQNTGTIPMINPITTQFKRMWNTRIVGNQVLYTGGNRNIFDSTNINVFPQRYSIVQRLKSNFIFLELNYLNSNNNQLILESVKSNFRQNEPTLQKT